MQIKITHKDVIWSYINYILSFVSNLIMLPFVTVLLSSEELGMWYTFLSVGAIVGLLDFGFMPCITRNVSYAWGGAEKLTKHGIPPQGDENTTNYNLLKVIMQSSRWIYLVISLAVLIFSSTCGTFYIAKISGSLYLDYTIGSWLIYGIALFLNIYYGYWTGCLQGVGAIKENNQAKVISSASKIIITLICLYLGLGLFAMAIGFLISGVLYRVIAKRSFFKYNNMEENLSKLTSKVKSSDIFAIVKVIWPNAWKVGLTSLGAYLITQGNTLLCSGFLGLDDTAVYGLSLQVCGAIISVGQIVFNAFQPQLIEMRLTNDLIKLKKTFAMNMTVYWIITLLGGIALVTIGLPLLKAIKANTALPVAVVVFMMCYLILEGTHSCFAGFISTGNEVPYVKASLVAAAGVFLLSLVLVSLTDLGIWGLMLGQCLVQLAYNNWKWPCVVLKEFHMSLWQFCALGFSYIKEEGTKLLRRR